MDRNYCLIVFIVYMSCYSILILGTYNYHQTVLFKWLYRRYVWTGPYVALPFFFFFLDVAHDHVRNPAWIETTVGDGSLEDNSFRPSLLYPRSSI
jgi:hypothetical protein